MDRVLPESVYTSKIRDSKFHIKNFLLNYLDLVDIDRLKNDKKGYESDLRKIDKLLPKDITKGNAVLFIYKKDISRMVFLTYASRFKKLMSFYHCPIHVLNDIYWGTFKNGDFGTIPEDILYSETSIRDDLFFLYCDRDATTAQRVDYTSSTIAFRINKNPKCKNVIFYRGTVDDMKTFEWSSNIYNSFLRNEYKIVDLNIHDSGTVKNLDILTAKSDNNDSNLGY